MCGQVHGNNLSVILGAFGPQQPFSFLSFFLFWHCGLKEDSWRLDRVDKLLIILRFLVSTLIELCGSTTCIQETSYFLSFGYQWSMVCFWQWNNTFICVTSTKIRWRYSGQAHDSKDLVGLYQILLECGLDDLGFHCVTTNFLAIEMNLMFPPSCDLHRG